MDNWGVVLVITALVGFIITVMTPLLKLNTSITKLNVTIENLNENLGETKAKLDAHEKESAEILEDHERRILLLEYKGGKNNE